MKAIYLLGLLLMAAGFLVSCADNSDDGISGPGWPNYDAVYGTWEWRNPTPTGAMLRDIRMVSEVEGWAVGDGGTLMHTTDGGTSWSVRTLDGICELSFVTFLDAAHGWVMNGYNTTACIRGYCDYPTKIARTTDGGQTWTVFQTGYEVGLYDLCFVDAQNGWAGGTHSSILHTSDGGATWNVQRQCEDANYDIFGVYFSDALSGWASGWCIEEAPTHGFLLRTTDGGATWAEHDTIQYEIPSDVTFIDAEHGKALIYWGGSMQTSDGGATWDNSEVTNQEIAISDARFVNANVGTCRGWGYFDLSRTFFRTVDGGTNWSTMSCEGDVVDWTSEQTGWAVGSGGRVFRTNDGGTAWTLQTSALTVAYLWDAQFTDAMNGVAVGNAGTIVRTVDGGESWTLIPTGLADNVELRAVEFMSSSSGWAVGGDSYSAVIAKTEDGGATWTTQQFATLAPLRDVVFVSPLAGWIVGEQGLIMHTVDGGVSWSLQQSGQSRELTGVAFSDDHTGWISVGSTEYGYSMASLLHTTDGGQTWTAKTMNGAQSLITLCTVGTENIWAVGWEGEILHSGDGGQTWMVQNSHTTMPLWCVRFLNPSLGYASGEKGTFLITTDGGMTWNVQPRVTENHFLGLAVYDPSHIIAVGSDGTIVRFVPSASMAF